VHDISDIDLMIRFKAESKIDLWDFVGIMQDLEDTLGCKVDLVREGGSKSFAVDNIEKDKLLVYEEKAKGQRAPGTHS
jgi:predicted nucleotidyltransferase